MALAAVASRGTRWTPLVQRPGGEARSTGPDAGAGSIRPGRQARDPLPHRAPVPNSTCSVPDRLVDPACRIAAVWPEPGGAVLLTRQSRSRRPAHPGRPRGPYRTTSAPTLGRLGVPGDVGEPLLGRAQQHELGVRPHRGRAVPVVTVTWTGMRVQRRPALRDASQRVAERSLSPAARAAARPPSAGPRTGSPGPAWSPRHMLPRASATGSPLACSAACSWVMIPVSPCASVSWISLAIRCRSSRIPASRAWVEQLLVQRSAFSARRRLQAAIGLAAPRPGPARAPPSWLRAS